MSELFAREGVGTIIAIATAASVAVLLGAVGLLVVDRLSLRGKLRQIDDLYKQSDRSEEHTSELQSLMRISYAVFCLKKKIAEANNEQQGAPRPLDEHDRREDHKEKHIHHKKVHAAR